MSQAQAVETEKRGGELAGKVALITGASSGIGYGIAELFGREGANVVINYLGYEQQAHDLASRLTHDSQRALAIEADVSNSQQVNSMVQRATSELGRIDVLVNNAGIEKATAFLDLPEQQWDKVLDVNLKGAFLCAQACARVMKENGGGSIVNISSIHEDLAFPLHTDYCASKGGLRMMMRNIAVELAPHKIRVNNVAPGAIATPINKSTLEDPSKIKELDRIIPLGRLGEPTDVAQVALFLASDRSAYVTGATYFVDGGMVRYAEAL